MNSVLYCIFMDVEQFCGACHAHLPIQQMDPQGLGQVHLLAVRLNRRNCRKAGVKRRLSRLNDLAAVFGKTDVAPGINPSPGIDIHGVGEALTKAEIGLADIRSVLKARAAAEYRIRQIRRHQIHHRSAQPLCLLLGLRRSQEDQKPSTVYVHDEGAVKPRETFTQCRKQLLEPLFNMGKNRARLRAKKAAYEQEVYAYEKTVLEAFSEVSNALVVSAKSREIRRARERLQEAARSTLELATLQYINGIISYLDVLDAQRAYFDAQVGLNHAVRDELLATVQLYKVLGGGVEVDDPVEE